MQEKEEKGEDKAEGEVYLLLWGPVALGLGTGTDLFLPPVVAAIFKVNLLTAIANQYAPVFYNKATGGVPGLKAGVVESLTGNRVGTVELVEGGALDAGEGGEGGGQHRQEAGDGGHGGEGGGKHRHQKNKKQQHF